MVATCRKTPVNATSSRFNYKLEDKNGWVWATDMTATAKGYIPVTYARLVLNEEPMIGTSNKTTDQVSCPRTSNILPRKKSSKTRVDTGRSRNKTEGGHATGQTTTNAAKITYKTKTKGALYISGPKPRPPPGHMSHASGNKVSNRVLAQHGSTTFSSRTTVSARNNSSDNVRHIAGKPLKECDAVSGRPPTRDRKHGLRADADINRNRVRKIQGTLFLYCHKLYVCH